MVESSGDTSQKMGLETNSGEFIPPRGAPLALSHSGPSKEIRQRSLKPPSRPLTGLPSSPSQDESHRLSSLSFPCLPFISRLRPLLGKPSKSFELARENSWEKAGEELSQDTLLGLGALWA